jgi:hypothetical protein
MNNKKPTFLPKLLIPIPDKEAQVSPILYKKQSIHNEIPKKQNINNKILDLALITLNITMEDYKNMAVNDLCFIDTNNNYSKILAVEILEHYKSFNFNYN